MTSPVVSEATNFLSPILDKTQPTPLNNASLTQRLAQSLPTPPHSSDPKSIASAVVTHALDLFQKLHAESRVVAADTDPSSRLINPAEVRIVTCLLDLIVLEGVYPSLSKGVGVSIERRTRSRALPVKRARAEDRRDVELLGVVVSRLSVVLSDGRRGGAVSVQMIEDRCLVDVVAGCAELAFNPGNGDTGEWKRRFEMLIDGIPTPKLLSQLLLLLHAQTPPFLRAPLSKALSNLPLTRPHAVQHIIELFLSTVTDTSASHVSVEALTSASRIICSVPSSVPAPDYFRKISPELLHLLDSPDQRLARAAGFVVADALGKRGRGIEEAVEEALVKPLISKLDPPPTPPPRREPPTLSSPFTTEENTELQQPLVSEEDVYNSLAHLELLSSSQPSPSVRHRLIAPLVLPLWALTNYAKPTSRSSWHARASSLLGSHLKTSAATDQDAATTLSNISANIMFSGNSNWEFGSGSQGGIEIRPRRRGSSGFDADDAESRIQELLRLLDDSGASATALSDFFLHLLRVWLGRRNSEGDDDPVGMFTTLKILQGVLSRHERALGKEPAQMLQVVKGVLDEYVDYREGVKRDIEYVKNPSLAGLGKIVQNAPPPTIRGTQRGGGEGEGEADEESERCQTVTMALSLLSALISSPSTKLTPSDERLLQTLHPPLSYISKPSPATDPDLSSLALNITSLLSLHPPTTTATSATSAAPETSRAERQKETYLLALSYLRDPLIPVRAHGLHLLRDLITSRAPILDVANTTRLAVDMLSDKDSFIYLNVVKTLSTLADRHSRTVTKMLVDAYLDDGRVKLGLDERLRIGEALLRTVQRLGGALVGETAEVVGRGMTAIISRRRIRKGGGNDKGEEWSENEQEEDDEEEEDEDHSRRRRREEEKRQKATTLQGWESKDDSEDLRIRTSALSILGVAIETNPTGMGPGVLADGIDMALSVLTLETATEKGILRRAAVVCIGSLLKSLVGMNEDDGDGGAEGHAWREDVWGVLGDRVKDVRRTLRYLVATDTDGLVREQAAVVLENLGAVIERWMVGGQY